MHFPFTFILFCLHLQFSNIVVGLGEIPAVNVVKGIVRAAARSKTSQGIFSNIQQPGITNARIKSYNMHIPQLEPSQAFNTGLTHFSAQNPLKLYPIVPKENHNSLSNNAKLNLRKIRDEGKSDHTLLKNFLEVGKSVVNEVMAEFKSFTGIFEGEKLNGAAQRQHSAKHSSRMLYSRSDYWAMENALTNYRNKFIPMEDEEIDDEQMEEIREKAEIVFEMEMKISEIMLQWDGDEEDDILPEFLPKKLAEKENIKIIVGNKIKSWVEMKKIIKNIQQIGQKFLKDFEMLDEEEKEEMREKLKHTMKLIEMKKLIKYIHENRQNYIKELEEMKKEEKEQMQEKIRNTMNQIEMFRMRLEMAEMAKIVSETVNAEEMKMHIEMIKEWRNRKENKAYFTDNSISSNDDDVDEEELSRYKMQIEGISL